jgi:hypothetical protein
MLNDPSVRAPKPRFVDRVRERKVVVYRDLAGRLGRRADQNRKKNHQRLAKVEKWAADGFADRAHKIQE